VTCVGAYDEDACVITIIGCDNTIARRDTKFSRQSMDESKIEMKMSALQERSRVDCRTHGITTDISIVKCLTIIIGVQTRFKL
jgi:hypothetical protein